MRATRFSHRVGLAAAAAIAVIAASCGATTGQAIVRSEPAAAVASTTTNAVGPATSLVSPVSSPTPVDTAPPLLFEHRFFPTIDRGEQTYVTYLSQDFERFVAEAEVVFTGRVRNVNMGVARTARFNSGADVVSIVYDGIVFDIEEVLLGEVHGPGQDSITLAFQAVTDYIDPQFADKPIASLGFEILEDGVIAAQRGSKGPLYIVFAAPVDIDGVTHLWPIGPAALGVIEGGAISPNSRFVVDRQLDGSPMTLRVFKEWLTEGQPRWDPDPEFYPPQDAPAGPIAIPGE